MSGRACGCALRDYLDHLKDTGGSGDMVLTMD